MTLTDVIKLSGCGVEPQAAGSRRGAGRVLLGAGGLQGAGSRVLLGAGGLQGAGSRVLQGAAGCGEQGAAGCGEQGAAGCCRVLEDCRQGAAVRLICAERHRCETLRR